MIIKNNLAIIIIIQVNLVGRSLLDIFNFVLHFVAYELDQVI